MRIIHSIYEKEILMDRKQFFCKMYGNLGFQIIPGGVYHAEIDP